MEDQKVSRRFLGFPRMPVISAICVICGSLLFHEVFGSQPGRAFSVMTFNVGTVTGQSPEMDRVTEIVAKGAPDLLFLQEVPGERQARDLAAALNDANYVYAPYPSLGGGLAMISRYPLRVVHFFRFNGYAALAAEASVDGRKVLLLSVHLERVRGVRVTDTAVELTWRKAIRLLEDEITKETPRTRAVEQILDWISSQPYEKAIIAGDFNTVPFSKAIRKMEDKYRDALWPGLHYLTGSYNMLPLLVRPRIDYIFHSQGLKCLTASIMKESAGDHYPIRAVFDSRGRG